MCIYFLALYP
jgi:cytochrome P450